MTLIEAARTMLADSLLHISFWAEAVNTACYVQNKVLVTKPHNKIPYELLIGRTPIISFMRPFGCIVTILNTLDHLGKFDGKADEGVLVGYSINSKDFRVYNHSTRKVYSYVPSSCEEAVSSPNDDAGKKIEQEPANEEDQTLKDALNKMMNQEKDATEHSNDVRKQFEKECNKQLFQGLDTRNSSANSFNTV
ncbi:retrovirus-related pol polyprotein from transposon TNT 1-94, partial [Tanacetum coccineum]